MDVYKTDEEQAEALKRWLRDNGISLVTGIMLGLAVLFGVKTWNEYGVRSHEAASNLYLQFQAASGKGLDEAIKQYDTLIKDFSGSEYAVLASLHMAKLQIDKGDAKAARAHLQWALDHAQSEGLKRTARLRLARLLLADGDVDAADKLIAGSADPSFTTLYEELRGDIALVRGKFDEAHAAYERALAAMPAELPGRALIEAKRDDALRGTVAAGPTGKKS
ncbi:MAG: tetratricopeptide repeat protein [Gammaproteobacteria bacterium]|nr:tetratricopeptide repeat protein [Gammaproteobacteria bacterium]